MLNYGLNNIMNISDIYYKKTIEYGYRGNRLYFKVPQSLFSSQDIDIGTRHLLDTLSNERIDVYNKVLDLGCGYGPIGISLKSFYKQGTVHMVDKDSLALDFSKQNVKLNKQEGIKIYGSLGYDDVSDLGFDLIVSNIPAKVGEPVLSSMVEDAKFYLSPKGRVAIVVIDSIGDYVTNVLKENKNINVTFYKRWAGHLVFHYQFINDEFINSKPKVGAFEKGIYNRGQKNIYIKGSKVSIDTAYGLPEFDTLSFETEMLINKLVELKYVKISRALIFNPGQGYIPSALFKYCETNEIVLADRDLEALRVSRKNLISNGFDSNRIFLYHDADFSQLDDGTFDLILGVLRDKEEFKINFMNIEMLSKFLSKNGSIILASSSTHITRVEKFIRKNKFLNVIGRQKSKGKSVLLLRKRI
jgi:16S rRNA G1207 methylase RsmC